MLPSQVQISSSWLAFSFCSTALWRSSHASSRCFASESGLLRRWALPAGSRTWGTSETRGTTQWRCRHSVVRLPWPQPDVASPQLDRLAWIARTGRAWRVRVSEGCVLRIARSTSFGAGNLAGKPRAPKHWCHCQNSVLSNLPLQPRAPALRAKRLTPLHRTVGFGHYDPGYQQVLRLRLRLLTCRTPAV